MSSAVAAQSTLFSAATSASGVMTLKGLSTGAQMPAVTVALEKNLKQDTIDFSSQSLAVGDKVTLSIAGGAQVVGTLDSNGLDAMLTSMASSVASQSGLFSAATSSSGVLTLTGLASGAAVPAVTVAVTSTNSVTKAGAYVPHPSSSPTANVSSGTPVASAPAGSEFQINTTTASSQEYPQTASLADGGYVVVWNSNNQDGSQYGFSVSVLIHQARPLAGNFKPIPTPLITRRIPRSQRLATADFW